MLGGEVSNHLAAKPGSVVITINPMLEGEGSDHLAIKPGSAVTTVNPNVGRWGLYQLGRQAR